MTALFGYHTTSPVSLCVVVVVVFVLATWYNNHHNLVRVVGAGEGVGVPASSHQAPAPPKGGLARTLGPAAAVHSDPPRSYSMPPRFAPPAPPPLPRSRPFRALVAKNVICFPDVVWFAVKFCSSPFRFFLGHFGAALSLWPPCFFASVFASVFALPFLLRFLLRFWPALCVFSPPPSA